MAVEQKQDVDIHQTTMIATDRLLLDKDNPRLASLTNSSDQFDLLKTLWTEMAVEELVFSIAKNGFFPEEPLFLIPANANDDPENDKTLFIVIEGNRRLAAVRILLDDTLRTRLRAANLPIIDAEAKARLRTLPASIYPNRRGMWAYLSFRHINSPKQWDSFAKAKYIAQVHREIGIPIRDIAEHIGDRHDTVERIYRGYKVLEQAENQTDFTIEDQMRNRFYFSHLYTAIASPEFQEFLGLDPDRFPDVDPVPKENINKLSELMGWIYGSRTKRTEPLVRKQAPDLGNLGRVISNQLSLEALRSGYSLEQAVNVSKGDESLFSDAIFGTLRELKTASATVSTGYSGDDDLYKIMEDIDEIRKSVFREMKRIRGRSTNRRPR